MLTRRVAAAGFQRGGAVWTDASDALRSAMDDAAGTA